MFSVFLQQRLPMQVFSYFENTLVHMFSLECNKKCREEIIKSETDFAVILLLKVVSQNLQQQLLKLERQVYD